MELMNEELSIGVDMDFKTQGIPEPRLCRGCLATNKRITRASCVDLYSELTHITVEDAGSWSLCYECAALLWSAVRTKRRLQRAHQLLAEYAARCAPFPIDASDKELLDLAAPALGPTETQIFSHEVKRGRGGFLATLTHTKVSLFVPECVGKLEVKDEDGSDVEDSMTLDEFKREFITDEDSLEVTSDRPDAPPDDSSADKKKRKKRDKADREIKKRLKLQKKLDELEEEVHKSRVRKGIEIDPQKIRVISLDPIEQMRAASNSPGALRMPFRCDLCHRGFNYEAKLHNHLKKHDPARGKFHCKYCSMYLPTVYSYKVHMLIHTTRYECLRCGKIMTDKGCIVEHYEAVHEGKVQQISCLICGKVSLNNKTHRGHMRNHHSGDRPRCDQCGKTFVNKDSLAEHELIHRGVKEHACAACPARFRTRTQLTHHQLRHSSARDFYCVECDVRFKSAHNLRQHLAKAVKHRDAGSLQYQCARCPLRLGSARALEHHVVFGHERRRLHACGECGARLATAGSLAKHTRTAHRGYRPPLKHVCDACGRAFRNKGVLINHMRTHTGEKPFECGECGRKFSQRGAVRTHIQLVHLKLKRGGKTRDAEEGSKPPAPPGVPPAPKEELRLEYEPWPRKSEVYYFLPVEQALQE